MRDQEDELVNATEAEEGFFLHGMLDDIQHEFYIENAKTVEEGIREFTQKKNINMLVMLKREYSFLDNLFHSRDTKTMAFHTDIPLLILHDGNN